MVALKRPEAPERPERPERPETPETPETLGERGRLLEVRDLSVCFRTEEGPVTAVDRVSFTVDHGETVAMVGESGCGKSATCLAIMRLLGDAGVIAGGSVRLEGAELTSLGEQAMNDVRGRRIAMVFQEPMTSLNPVFTVGDQVQQVIRAHRPCGPSEARGEAAELLRLVGIPSPERRLKEYPHQLSGGMRQRVMIAIALACRPALLIGDEPTTALDATIQAQILDLIQSLSDHLRMSVLLVSHDLGVVAEMAQRVVIMYAGRVLEEASAERLLEEPRHPYTRALIECVPVIRSRRKLGYIKGNVPDFLHLPSGCKFHPRCPSAEAICGREEPPLFPSGEGGSVRCWTFGDRASNGDKRR